MRERTIWSGKRGFASRAGAAAGAFVVALLSSSAARAEETTTADVHVRGPGLPQLEARAPGYAWEPVCVTPCTRRLDLSLDYRVAGEGLVTSPPFRLPPSQRVRVDVAAGSPMLATVGTLLIVGGVLFAVGGGTILVLPDDPHASSGDKTVVGVGFIASGLVTAGVGILARLFAETHVALTPEAP
jgi:hypothetical protein